MMTRFAVLLLALIGSATATCYFYENIDPEDANYDMMAWRCLEQEIFPPAIYKLRDDGACTDAQMDRNKWPCDDLQCNAALKAFYKTGIDTCFFKYPAYSAYYKCTIDQKCAEPGQRRLDEEESLEISKPSFETQV
mmetsp:Transcript_89997/g.164896  ORF Transcript_89997/g.164896 Transcript_89997/m.164896 type:complete len:136 (-) Transcript_89997:19-426(-)